MPCDLYVLSILNRRKESAIITDLQCVVEYVLQEVVWLQLKAIIRDYKILVERALVSYMITF